MNSNFLISLEIMGKGMVSIFVVLGILSLVVMTFSKIFK